MNTQSKTHLIHKAIKTLIYRLILYPIHISLEMMAKSLGFTSRKIAGLHNYYSRALYRRFSTIHTHDPKGERAARQKAHLLALEYIKKSGTLAQFCPFQPKVTLIIPLHHTPPPDVDDTLKSVILQSYKNWEIVIIHDTSIDPLVSQHINHYKSQLGPQLVVGECQQTDTYSIRANRGISLARGDYVAFVAMGDIVFPHALAEMIRTLNYQNQPEILYSDEKKMGDDGIFLRESFYKPDWSPLFHLSFNYTQNFTIYFRPLVDAIGGFRHHIEGMEHHDLMLRAVEKSQKPVVHVPLVLMASRIRKNICEFTKKTSTQHIATGVDVLTETLTRRGRPALVTWVEDSSRFRIRFKLPKNMPKVTIIIPTRDQSQILQSCINSVRQKTSYPHYEVLIVNNDSHCVETLNLFSAIRRGEYDGRGTFRIIDIPGPFNFALLNNEAVKTASGDFIVLLNNDTIVKTPDWLEEMLSLAQWPEVGAVGCKLLYEDETIQHAGIVLKDRRIAGHSLRTLPAKTSCYHHIADTIHEVSAVTGACLMIRKKHFIDVGMLDEIYLPNGFGDVDFCLKLQRNGLTNVYTPHAVLTHLESKSRGESLEQFEKKVMLDRWGKELISDRYVHPNFSGSEYYQAPEEIQTTEIDRLIIEKLWTEHLPSGS